MMLIRILTEWGQRKRAFFLPLFLCHAVEKIPDESASQVAVWEGGKGDVLCVVSEKWLVYTLSVVYTKRLRIDIILYVQYLVGGRQERTREIETGIHEVYTASSTQIYNPSFNTRAKNRRKMERV